MQTENVMRFNSIEELQSTLTQYLDILKKDEQEHSRLIGDKFRLEQDGSSIQELDKLADSADPKKKKPKKKDQKTNWRNFGEVAIFDGVGSKGELELYFKSLESLKSKIEKMKKTKESIDHLISKGLKSDLACAAFMTIGQPLEIAFIKSDRPTQKFSHKAIYSVGVETVA